MAWIEVHQSLPSHRKTLAAATLLGIRPVQMTGHLVTLWLWAIDNAPEGNLSSVSPPVISRAAEWPGRPDAFVDALVMAKLLDRADNTLIIHDWPDYAGRLCARRAANKERMRSARALHVQRTESARAAHVQGLPYLTVPNQDQDQEDAELTHVSSGAAAPLFQPAKSEDPEPLPPKSVHELRDDAISALQDTTSQRDKVGVVMDLWPLVFGSRYPPPDGGLVARMGTLAGGFGQVVTAMVSAAAAEITDDPRDYIMGVLNGRRRRDSGGSGHGSTGSGQPAEDPAAAARRAAVVQAIKDFPIPARYMRVRPVQTAVPDARASPDVGTVGRDDRAGGMPEKSV